MTTIQGTIRFDNITFKASFDNSTLHVGNGRDCIGAKYNGDSFFKNASIKVINVVNSVDENGYEVLKLTLETPLSAGMSSQIMGDVEFYSRE